MRPAYIIALAAAVFGIGAGVGIGAVVWSGSSGEQAVAGPQREFSSKPKLVKRSSQAQVRDYDHGFTMYATSFDEKLKWTPYYADSHCGTPKDLVSTGWDLGGVGAEYRGNANIEDSGSCYFETTYVYWRNQYGRAFGLGHSRGSYWCADDSNCGVRRDAGVFVYTGGP